MDNNNATDSAIVVKKKTMGRRKIPLDQKIQKKSNRQVTFTKRRQGLSGKPASSASSAAPRSPSSSVRRRARSSRSGARRPMQ
ncbi:agamous-like mads-box protein agl62 [Phtheirospermum japonicum]|uniref:Agamous-like mads-box protein agl62 n=1 Tax=Phtheirospermum japonicum TaxID=374723 RepID=A0A830D8X6_9LAMI|nr:agamous-like mads-box protein agl62 [Phtheirospermum japonicum]